MKLKKRKKSGRFRGSRMHGRSAKKAKGKGHHGGKGMSGTGKKAGQKRTLVDKYYYPYFGRRGFTSRPTAKDKKNQINIGDIEKNISSLGKKGKDGWEIDLPDYKILGEGELKEKLVIKAKAFSKSAKEKIEKAGGRIIEKESKPEKDKAEKK